MSDVMLSLTEGMEEREVARARAQIKAGLVMNLESASGRADQIARGKSTAVLRRVARLTFLSAPTCTSRNSKPAAGTSRFSIPRAVPMKSSSAA
jgi:hypothetical protein